MAKTDHYYQKIEPNCFYHIYNRGVAKTNIFSNAGNYTWFLKQYDKYLSEIVETWSYALLPNHFHFCVKIKPMDDLLRFENMTKSEHQQQSLQPQKVKTPHDIVAHQFQKFFQSYAMAFNKQENRVGTLFQTPFKRCAVDPDKIMRLIIYHHINPQHHHLTQDFRTYAWTSYSRYLLDGPSKLPREQVFNLFNGKEKFLQLHKMAYMEWGNSLFIEE